MASDIILIGAGRSPETRLLRAKAGYSKRNVWIGTLEVRTGMRYPVDGEFLRKNFDAIVAGVQRGVLIVEYKFDRHCDPDELKTLAFGSDAEREAYEKEASEAVQARAVELDAAKRERAEQDAADRAVNRLPVAPPPAADEETALDNMQGSHEVAQPSAQEAADERLRELAAAPSTEVAHNEALAVASEVELVGDGEDESDQSYAEDLRPLGEGEYKPLPDGWQKAAKPELLGFCAERGIDITDMPNNRALKKRLERYEEAHTK